MKEEKHIKSIKYMIESKYINILKNSWPKYKERIDVDNHNQSLPIETSFNRVSHFRSFLFHLNYC